MFHFFIFQVLAGSITSIFEWAEVQHGQKTSIIQSSVSRMQSTGSFSRTGKEAQIPDSRSPVFRFGRESGRESPFPDSAKIGKRGFPVSRFGRDRESGNPRFPIPDSRPNRGPDGGGPGTSWSGGRMGGQWPRC